MVQNWEVTSDQPTPSPTARRLVLTSVLPVWLLAVVGAVLVGVLSSAGQYLTWLPIVMAAAILLTFCIQLAIVQKEGLVNRVTACLGGSIVILGIATIVLGILQLAAT